MSTAPTGAADAVRDAIVRVDEAMKAVAVDAAAGRERAERRIEAARDLLEEVADDGQRRELAGQLARRAADLDAAVLDDMLQPTPDVARAPTRDVDPARIPPGQHLTPGWPVLHVGAAPQDPDPASWTVTVTGRVRHRLRLTRTELAARFEVVEQVSDFHCVTRWSRLDNRFTGVRVADVLAAAAPHDDAVHLLVSGRPAYSADLALEAVRQPEPVAAGSGEVLLAWAHDGADLAVAHGGPLRLVAPSRYGWKSVKWVTELRLVDRVVPGYWEERGYHAVGGPHREERFADR